MKTMANNEIRIGKTVIETLTQGMYEDSRFIYREYIQNAVDAIDKAVENKVLENRKSGKVFVKIDNTERSIIIEDNGTGISEEHIYATLGNIALSEKNSSKDKGFRGIGRLGGLGYCDKLIFETSFAGEATKTLMTWDAVFLREKLLDENIKDDASDIVKSIITLNFEQEDSDQHYFKVTLCGVNSDELLDVKDIMEYLSMVAPIPYLEKFYYKESIYKYTKENNLEIDEYHIYVNSEQISKPYSTHLYEDSSNPNNNKKTYDEIIDIKFFNFSEPEKATIAWGWYGISRFEKQIPKRLNYFRGLRLRKGNIQIGDEQTLLNRKIPREDRANGYFIGEIFCIHPDLKPNSRRDYFNENHISKELEKQLKELFYGTLHELYYTASNYRGAIKKIQKVTEIEEEFRQKEKIGFVGDEQKTFKEKLGKAKTEAETAAKNIEKIKTTIDSKQNQPLAKVFEHIEKHYPSVQPKTIGDIDLIDNSKIDRRVDKLSQLSRAERKLLDKIFVIINETLPPPQAEELIQKIESEFK
jgi:molecular chaperone HtpG